MIIKFTLLFLCLLFTIHAIRINIQEVINAVKNREKDKLYVAFWFWCIITILLWTSYIVLI